MKRENCKITFTSGGKSVTVSGDDFSGFARTLGKEEKVDNCPRCHSRNFRQWLWLKRVMRKCHVCGRIWSYDEEANK